MDQTTRTLIDAINLLLTAGRIPAPPGHPDRWMFQEDSEIHLVLAEALRDARAATGTGSLQIGASAPGEVAR